MMMIFAKVNMSYKSFKQGLRREAVRTSGQVGGVTCSWESRSSLWASRLSCSARRCCSSAVSASCCSRSRFISCVFTVWICTRKHNLVQSQGDSNMVERPGSGV